MTTPTYSRIEYERRFLVNTSADWRNAVKPYSKLLNDRYLEGGRLRLRRIEDSDTGRIAFKLTKKYESDSRFEQPIVSVWLSRAEYEQLIRLPGSELTKRRFYDEHDGIVFSIDQFHGSLKGLVLCEVESDSIDQLRTIRFPPYSSREVTENEFFTGAALSRATAEQLNRALKDLLDDDKHAIPNADSPI